MRLIGALIDTLLFAGSPLASVGLPAAANTPGKALLSLLAMRSSPGGFNALKWTESPLTASHGLCFQNGG